MLNRLIRSEEGIAIITVLLVIAVVGVFGVLTLSAAREDLRFSTSDTAAEQAFDRAEAGLDSAVDYLTLHTVKPTDTCVLPSTTGCFKLINPTTGSPDIEIALSDTDPNGAWVEFRVRSTASVRGTRRTLQQMNKVNLLSLPYGLFIRGNLDFKGTFDIKNESILVEGNVTGRDFVEFDNTPLALQGVEDQDYGWIYHQGYINPRGGPPPCVPLLCPVPAIQLCPSSGVPGFYYAHLDLTLPVACAGVYASGTISLVGGGAAAESREIHPGQEVSGWKNPLLPPATCITGSGGNAHGDALCTQDRDIHQRKIDALGNSQPVVDVPDPLVIVRHLEELRRTAQNQGLYFNTTSGGGSITIGTSDTQATDSAFHRHFSRDLVFFIDTRASQKITLSVNVAPDSTSAELWEKETCIGSNVTDFSQPSSSHATEVSSQSGLIIVRGGGTLVLNDVCWSGAVFNQSGSVKIGGTTVFVGTIWGENLDIVGGPLLKLHPTWFGRIPAGFRDVERKDWVECESFVSGSC